MRTTSAESDRIFVTAKRQRPFAVVPHGLIARRALSLFTVLALALIALAGVPLTPVPAVAAGVYYVSTTGSDANPGTFESPWRTVQKAATAAQAGDVVYVRAGTYNEHVRLAGAGTAAAPIRISGYGTERPVVSQGFYFSGSYTTLKQFHVTPGFQGSAEGGATRRAAINLSGTYNTCDDVTFDNLSQGVTQDGVYMGQNAYATFQNADLTDFATWDNPCRAVTMRNHNTLRNCILDAAAFTGRLECNDYALIEDCVFSGPGFDYFKIGGSHTTLRRNVFYGAGRPVGNGTHTETGGFTHMSTSSSWTIEDVTLDSNIFASQPGGVEWDPQRAPGVIKDTGPPFHIFFWGQPQTVTYDNIRFTNNIFLGGTRLIDMNGTNTVMGTLYFYNNVFDGMAGPSLENRNVWRNNICGKGFTIRSTSGGAAQDADYNLYWDDHHSAKPTGEGSHSVVGEPGFVSPVSTAATRFGLDGDWRVTSAATRFGLDDSYSPTVDISGKTRVAPLTVGANEYVGPIAPVAPPAAAPKMSLAASTKNPAYGSVKLSGWLRDGSVPMSGKQIELRASSDNKNWTRVATIRTSATAPGHFSYTAKPTKRTYYRVFYAGAAGKQGATSASISVLPKVYLTKPYYKSTQIKCGRTYKFRGTLKPIHNSTKAIKILAYRKVGGKYRYRKTFYGKTKSSATYYASVRLPSKGKWRLRAYHATDGLNSKTYSGYRYVTVK